MINYCQQYFGKNLTDLNYHDIQKYFEESKEESNKIEFKAYHREYGDLNKSIKGIIRAICAFLNSNGGIIIWGAPIENKLNKKDIFQGNLSPVDQFINKDSLISKISDSIDPLPVNINVEILEDSDNYIYIFEIQISNYSPHQYCNTYFTRLDGQTKPAPHYLVEALFKKISYPNIEGYINLDEFGELENDYVYLDITIIIINFSEFQNEYNLTYSLVCYQAIFLNSQNPDIHNYFPNANTYINKDSIPILHFGAPYENRQRLKFKKTDLANDHENKMDLILTFGGKKSPLKISDYKLDFGKPFSKDNLLNLFENKNENLSSSERQKELRVTRESILKFLLKR